jgi:Subtilase family
LSNVLNSDGPDLQLRADPNSLAPERLLVFEVTGSVTNFAKAVARIPGLEFAGEEELAADDLDQNPQFYLLVPQLAALREIVSLWQRWQRDGALPSGYAPWRNLFEQLRAVRPWGPSDRVSPENIGYFQELLEGSPDDELFRVEIELVFRRDEAAVSSAEDHIAAAIAADGGQVIDRAHHPAFAYHALLADLRAAELRRIVALDPASLAGLDPIASIMPQSIGTPIEAADPLAEEIGRPLPIINEPIAAVFDAVPLQAHPLLAGRLLIDDPEDLQSIAVGRRVHGTAMASLALHGDLNESATPISRPLYFRPVMYSPALGDERFKDDRLLIDVIFEAVMTMRTNGGTQVVLVNLSLGDRTKPFSGKISTWARALDYLSFTYGLLFLVSAGNSSDNVTLIDFADTAAFAQASLEERDAALIRAIDAVKADRRVLAPADSINAVTVGAWHKDSSQDVFGGASPFPAYSISDMPNISSRLGHGLRRSAKPEALVAGGREHVRFVPGTAPPQLNAHPNPSRFWGLKVAAPAANGAGIHFTMGTSAATALATHTAHRIFDALEEAYPQLIGAMPLVERAALLKALLVHSASWRGAGDFLRSIVDPGATLHHEHWRREVSRHLGFGFVDPDETVACAGDRATMWATGTLGPSGSLTFDIPLPDLLAASPDPREVRTTLAWFTPIRPGHLAYRAVKLRVASLSKSELNLAGLDTTSDQPSNTQAESGTLLHRRWRAAQIGECQGDVLPIQIQREPDQGTPIDEPIPFGLAVTIEMPGEGRIYEDVLTSIVIQPRVIVRV